MYDTGTYQWEILSKIDTRGVDRNNVYTKGISYKILSLLVSLPIMVNHHLVILKRLGSQKPEIQNGRSLPGKLHRLSTKTDKKEFCWTSRVLMHWIHNVFHTRIITRHNGQNSENQGMGGRTRN